MSLRHAVGPLLLAVAAAAAGCRGNPAQPRPARTFVAGTPEEIGRSAGRAHAATIRELHAVMLAAGKTMTLQSRERLYARAARLAQQLSAEDREEIRGLAAGSGLSYEDALFLNLFYSLTNDLPACRQLAAWGAATADGELIHARNLDWIDYPGRPLQRCNLILNVRPAGGVEYLLLTWPGFQGALTGTNRKGLTIAFNQLGGRWESGAPLSEPVFFTIKRALRSCSTLDEAVRLFRAARPLGNGSVMISDAGARKAVVLEILGGEVRERRPDGEMIANANHPTREAGWPLRRSGSADEPIIPVVRRLGGPLDAEGVRQVMADRRVMQEINLLSAVFVPAKNRLLLSCGRPRAAQGRFEEYALFPAERR